jgi:hypothetical protein
MGGRLKVRPIEERLARSTPFLLDVVEDARGELFELSVAPTAPEFQVLQVAPKEKHLLLRSLDGQRFLCGHDERHWFVASIGKPVSTVRAAKQALLPPAVWEQVKHLPPGEVDNRRNAVFKRQGEWFFVPSRHAFTNPVIHTNEPLQRTPRSKPHLCEELVRDGGELVYIVGSQALSEARYKERKKSHPDFDAGGVRTMVRNPEVYVRGSVRHPDHATIHLDGWHRVFLNAEVSNAGQGFLD